MDQVLLIFGYLFHSFSTLPADVEDPVSSSAVLKSIEARWEKTDQAVFVATVILNPLHKLQPFSQRPEFTLLELHTLFKALWKRFYEEEAPSELTEELEDYLKDRGPIYSGLATHVR